MPSSRKQLEKYSLGDLIEAVQGLETLLQEATETQELERFNTLRYQRDAQRLNDQIERLPHLIRWWYGC